MKLENKEKLEAKISKCVNFVNKHPEYVFCGVELMLRNSIIAVRKQMALYKAYSNAQKAYDTYRRNVVKRFARKKYWPRTKQKKFHQMRVGA